MEVELVGPPSRVTEQTFVDDNCGEDSVTILTDRSLLRAVPASTLLANLGYLLKKPELGWQYKMSLDQAEALYATSRQVDNISWFISHSWRDGRWTKYLAIAWTLNYIRALLMANAVSAVWVIARFIGVPLPTIRRFDNDPIEGYVEAIFSLAFVFGILLDFTWRWRKVEPSFFLDKSCIHQTDPTRKQLGISNIGGFLRASQRMLVLWGPDYFDRLWCNYEVACFMKMAGLGSIDVVPLWLPPFCMYWLTFGPFDRYVLYLLMHVIPPPCQLMCWFLSNYIILVCVFRFMRKGILLRHRVAEFRMDQSQCYCCNVGHILPDTGLAISCDRKFVENNIKRWYARFAGENGCAITVFESRVRKDLGKLVRSLGPHLPYSFFVLAMCYTGWKRAEDCILNGERCLYHVIESATEWIGVSLTGFAWWLVMNPCCPRLVAAYGGGRICNLRCPVLADCIYAYMFLIGSTFTIVEIRILAYIFTSNHCYWGLGFMFVLLGGLLGCFAYLAKYI